MATETETEKAAPPGEELTYDFQPLGARVLVKPIEEDERTPSGLYIPQTAREKPMRGEVRAVGPGTDLEDGTRRPVEVKVGDTILYGKYAGTEIRLEGVSGETLMIIPEKDVLGTLTRVQKS